MKLFDRIHGGDQFGVDAGQSGRDITLGAGVGELLDCCDQAARLCGESVEGTPERSNGYFVAQLAKECNCLVRGLDCAEGSDGESQLG